MCNNCSEEDSEAVAKTDEHTFVNNKCQCGKTQDSVELAFTKRSNYYFVSGIGECTDSCIVVPSYYEGLPVRSIAAEAFSKVTSFEEIILPETLCTIGRAAFSGCKGLKEITIPSGIEILDFETFTGCTNLEKVTLPSGLLQIFEYCFSGCTSLKEINLPDSLLKIRESAFYNCTSLKSISLPFSLNEIQQNAFMDCSSLSIQYLGSTSCFQQITKGYDWAVNTQSSYVQCYGGKVSIHTNKVVNK